VLISSSSEVVTRADIPAEVTSPTLSFEINEANEVSVRWHGAVAV